MTISGIDLNYELWFTITGPAGFSLDYHGMEGSETEVWWFYYQCQASGHASVSGPEVSLEANGPGISEGEFTWRVWQVETGQSDEVTLTLAEDCSALEFVPEPASIMLLGSGLAGLAGYATLRWRTRE